QAVIYSPWVFDLDAYGASDGVTFSTQSGALGIDVGYFFIRPDNKNTNPGNLVDDGVKMGGGPGNGADDPVLAARLSGKIDKLSASATLVRHHADETDVKNPDKWSYNR